MDATIVSAMAAVLGSLAGGAATLGTAWVTQRAQNRRELVAADIRNREALYAEFIRECSRHSIDSLSHTLESLETVLPIYALLNRIRLSASDQVLAEAERTMKRLVDQYYSPNMSLEQIRAMVDSESIDPLKPFGEACRRELASIRAAM